MGEISQTCSDFCACLVSQVTSLFLAFDLYRAQKHYRRVKKKDLSPQKGGLKSIKWDFVLGGKESFSSSFVDSECT